MFEEKIEISHPDNLSARAWAAADYITDILPRSVLATPQPPAPTPAPRPAARAERPRIVPPTQEGSAFRAENRSDFLAPPAEPPQPAEVLCAGYILMPQTSTYALGVQALRQACQRELNADPRHRFVRPDGSRIYRPLKFKDNLQARVENYNTLHNPDGTERSRADRLKLFSRWQDSCMGAAYLAESTRFKLIPECEQLITIPADFNGAFLEAPYNTWNVPELDSAARGAKFNQDLSASEVLEQPGWRAAAEEDIDLLRGYRDIVFAELQQQYRRDKGMGFYVRQNTPTDELRALFVHILGLGSYADGRDDLFSLGSFLRVAHR